MPASNCGHFVFMGYVRGEGRDQGSLFPVRLEELVPEQHLVRVIDAFVDRLELAKLGFEKAVPTATGRPAYHPGDLLKLYLYGYLNRVRSSRRLERECQRNVEVMWLLGRLAPDHKTIADFRRVNGKGLRAACASFVRFCRAAGLLGGEWVAIDGSKFRAVASNDRAVTRKQLLQEQAKLEERVAQYLADLDRCDREDGETHLREEQLKAALEVLERHTSTLELMEEQGLTQRVDGEPEAKLMHTRAGTQVAYNVQTAVDAKHALVIAHEVTSEVTDNRSLQPMAQAAKEALGVESIKVAADAGYSSGEQAAACEAAGIEPFVPPNRSDTPGGGALFSKVEFKYDAKSDTYRCPANQLLVRKQLMRKERAVLYTTDACGRCKLRKRCTTGRQRHIMRHLFEDALQRLKRRVEEHPEAMRLRRSTVEHPFGTLKYQIFGHPRFLLRGRRGAGSEMALAILAYNLKRALAVLGIGELLRRLAVSPR
jgi:transposase